MIDPASLQNWIDYPPSSPPLPFGPTASETEAIDKALDTLAAAFQVFFNESFRYVRELTSDRDAVLEFELELDGIKINGVDLLKWNDAGKIVEFKVMLRPLKAVNLIHQKMAAMLEAKP